MGWGQGWVRCPLGNTTGRGLREGHEDWGEEIQVRPEGSWQSPQGRRIWGLSKGGWSGNRRWEQSAARQ